ncbi:GNAT family N-acetyltransferase [Anaerobacillus sp. CMMVII]|uniref:GNAT family N-acetyltransferase n=1 Tax=Anaerobacillus sp. CMMVII TaxID=2755588 RepID=UPI0021B7B4BC|nr:GNAT family protein [Anaerobacillus sp. CMMVII]MCT8138308.1 GNAT family N-acetyltransferase [Anaerobacillus sp. CMMVII]
MLEFLEVNKEMEADIVDFITKETWPFHGVENPTEQSVREKFQSGLYTEKGNQSFWIVKNGEKIGVLRLFDLEDPTCLFDLRFKESARGQGLGAEAVKWLTDYVFSNYPAMVRIEGHTRNDNYAMRKTLFLSSYVKEAYHRKAWPQNGRLYDSVGYAMTRDDWESGKVTEIDDPCSF